MTRTVALVSILLPLLATNATLSADSVDGLAEKYGDLKRSRLLSLQKSHYEALLKVMESALADGDLALATKADAKIEAMKTEIYKLNPTEEWAAPITEKLVVGKWVFRSYRWSGIRDFRSDGSIDAGIDGDGDWKIVGDHLIVEFANGASAVFDLPARDGALTGKSGGGVLLKATKVKADHGGTTFESPSKRDDALQLPSCRE